MPITRTKKEEIYKKLEDGLKESLSTVFVHFKGLTVGEITELRKKLREAGISYMVSKKTIAKKVLDSLGLKGEIPDLTGEVALAYGKDSLAPAREVREFEKKFKNKLSILGGVFEGEYKDKAMMTELASIPSREVLLSQIAFLLKSPMQRLAIGVSEVAKKKA